MDKGKPIKGFADDIFTSRRRSYTPKTTRKVEYEWEMAELIDGDRAGDLWFSEDIPDIEIFKDPTIEVGLVRYRTETTHMHDGRKFKDEIERGYAYIIDGKFPEEFDDGYKIPQYFHKRLAKIMEKIRA